MMRRTGSYYDYEHPRGAWFHKSNKSMQYVGQTVILTLPVAVAQVEHSILWLVVSSPINLTDAVCMTFMNTSSKPLHLHHRKSFLRFVQTLTLIGTNYSVALPNADFALNCTQQEVRVCFHLGQKLYRNR